MNILITGAGGFLGSALVNKFSTNKNQISILVRKNTNLSRISDLSTCNLGICETDNEIFQFITDVRPDAVIHTANSYGKLNESMAQIIDSNIRYGAVILEAIKELNRKIIFINTGTALPHNANFYAYTKKKFENLAGYVSDVSNQKIQFINIKLHNMYGPGDGISKFPAYVINACQNNVPILNLTKGEQIRDFIFIEDVVEAYVITLDNSQRCNQKEIIELGLGVGTRVRDFVETVHKYTNSQTKLLFGQIPYGENEEMHMVANINFLKSLDWYPRYNIESGIKRTLEYIKNSKK